MTAVSEKVCLNDLTQDILKGWEALCRHLSLLHDVHKFLLGHFASGSNGELCRCSQYFGMILEFFVLRDATLTSFISSWHTISCSVLLTMSAYYRASYRMRFTSSLGVCCLFLIATLYSKRNSIITAGTITIMVYSYLCWSCYRFSL